MISKGEITFIPPCCLYTVCFVALHSQLWHVRVCVCGSLRTISNAQLHHAKDKWSCSASLPVFEDDQPREWAGRHPSNTARSPGRGGILTPSQKSPAHHSQLRCLHLNRVRAAAAAARTDLLTIQTPSAISTAEGKQGLSKRPSWMGPWAPWSSRRCPCSRQRAATTQSLRSFLTQSIFCFCDSRREEWRKRWPEMEDMNKEFLQNPERVVPW